MKRKEFRYGDRVVITAGEYAGLAGRVYHVYRDGPGKPRIICCDQLTGHAGELGVGIPIRNVQPDPVFNRAAVLRKK